MQQQGRLVRCGRCLRPLINLLALKIFKNKILRIVISYILYYNITPSVLCYANSLSLLVQNIICSYACVQERKNVCLSHRRVCSLFTEANDWATGDQNVPVLFLWGLQAWLYEPCARGHPRWVVWAAVCGERSGHDSLWWGLTLCSNRLQKHSCSIAAVIQSSMHTDPIFMSGYSQSTQTARPFMAPQPGLFMSRSKLGSTCCLALPRTDACLFFYGAVVTITCMVKLLPKP